MTKVGKLLGGGNDTKEQMAKVLELEGNIANVRQITVFCEILLYLSNRPQVSMGYKLINHAGCWWNTRRICKSRAAGE